MNIGGRNYRLKYDPKACGATFILNDSDGQGEIVVGTKWSNKFELATAVLHEALEVILHQDGKASTPTLPHIENLYDDPLRFNFAFDHDYLVGLCTKLLHALESSRWFIITDPRKTKSK